MTSGCAVYSKVQKDQRDELIVNHLALVKRIAYHLLGRLPSTVQVDDLIQAGTLGLIEAAKNYDPSQGASFETYAGIRIRGSILDEVRHGDWSPRSLHKKMRQLSEASREIENQTGRDARDFEIAEKLNISLDDYHVVLRESATIKMSSLSYSEETPDQDIPTDKEPLSVLQKEGFQQALTRSISELPEREQLMMSLYYNEELNFKEIGQVLEVSESRVCQIHTQTMAILREKMTDWTGN
ncbi:MAG: RNA polymerase sigma factor FliA [Gammaproteobacteria bacterium]|nr:RNA polymerase sigma factor FliA [Gammaproteobacteria bacterium]MCW8911674.1 RNA polymerase sigma factor FliA [Gammaproteobacteria bacterium]MCW9003932.1 RNA polymerase sigma factor FliA [Gammaproteobacteria bacterium]MCW9056924.1 RNA polymerase sigma factor FliA [Gammaproteobacteria bacterium]